jgi:hypothetical protein
MRVLSSNDPHHACLTTWLRGVVAPAQGAE